LYGTLEVWLHNTHRSGSGSCRLRSPARGSSAASCSGTSASTTATCRRRSRVRTSHAADRTDPLSAQSRHRHVTPIRLAWRRARTHGHPRARRHRSAPCRGRGAPAAGAAVVRDRRAGRPGVPGGEGARALGHLVGGARVADEAAHHGQPRAGGAAQGRVGLRPADRTRRARSLPPVAAGGARGARRRRRARARRAVAAGAGRACRRRGSEALRAHAPRLRCGVRC